MSDEWPDDWPVAAIKEIESRDDALEAQAKEIKRLYRDTAAAIDEVAALRELLQRVVDEDGLRLSTEQDIRAALAKQEDGK